MNKNELLQMNDGSELSIHEWVEATQERKLKESKRRECIMAHVWAITFVIVMALICPKCSDADDRAIGLPAGSTTK